MHPRCASDSTFLLDKNSPPRIVSRGNAWFMTFDRGNIGYLIAFIIVGGILGSALGHLAAKLVPALSIVQQNLTAPIGFNLEVVSFNLKLNIGSVAGMIAGIVLFRKA